MYDSIHISFRSLFQMTVEINYEIAIAKFGDWFKNLSPIY